MHVCIWPRGPTTLSHLALALTHTCRGGSNEYTHYVSMYTYTRNIYVHIYVLWIKILRRVTLSFTLCNVYIHIHIYLALVGIKHVKLWMLS